MSTKSRWAHLDPLTRNDLTRSGSSGGPGGAVRYHCGCTVPDGDRIWLCDYHEGFEDGAEAARNDMEKEEQ
jgi:hypothetical protein